MATTLTVNGTGYSFPAVGDRNWGANVSNWAAAVTSGMLQKAGGSFVLTAEVDFGATYGLKSSYFKSRATSPASAGVVRLGNAETIKWRNAADSADLALTVNASNQLTFDGVALAAPTLTASRALVSDGSGIVSASSVTSTELGYVSGVTSAIQTQFSGKVTGPASVTDGNIALFNGTTGKLIKESGTLSIALGGTNSSTSLSNNRVMKSSGGAIVEAAAITASRALISDANGIPTHSATTSTELGYVNGVTSAIQTQLNAKTGGSATAKSADYTVTDTDGIYTVLMTTSSTNRTVTLPTASDNSGRVISVKKVDTGTGKCTVDGEGSETIDGATTFDLVDQDDYVTMQCDGTGWNIIAKGIGTRTVSRVKDEVGAGHGSTNTKIRRIETNVVNTGNAITRAVSSTNGNSYTINQNGVFSIAYTDAASGTAVTLGISNNSAALTTSIDSITSATRVHFAESPTSVLFGSCSVTVRLASGDVIRPHTDGNPNSTSAKCAFQIQKIGL